MKTHGYSWALVPAIDQKKCIHQWRLMGARIKIIWQMNSCRTPDILLHSNPGPYRTNGSMPSPWDRPWPYTQGICIATTGTNPDTCHQIISPIFFFCITATLGFPFRPHAESTLIHQNILDLPDYRLSSISRYYQMYVTVIQKTSISPEALVGLFDSCKSLVLIKLLHFFLRTLLVSAILLCIKSKHFWYTYILWNQYQPHHLPNWCPSETEIDPHA